MAIRAEKDTLRERLLAHRAARPAAERAAAEADIAEHGLARCAGLRRVAAYAGVGDEPGTHALLDGLLAAGVTVLLPVLAPGRRLDWAPYAGWPALAAGAFGLLQPTEARVAGDALASVDLVLAPALAVDRAGNRLGRGAGYYDRALAGVPPSRVAAVVYADEVLDAVPAQPHDRPVGHVLTPEGFVALG